MRRGDLIAGRFVLEETAGTGGMGDVYRALALDSGAPVAVKVLKEGTLSNVERFRREATLLAELSHPGIVRYVCHGTAADGRQYLVMEWIDGQSLSQRLAQDGLSAAESVAVVRRVAEALAEAHRHGVVHRDIKPSHILFPDGSLDAVKVIDFGIARRAIDPQVITRSGTMVGSPGYMAPEQARGGLVDARADVFALGCVLHECVTGQPAWTGENLMAVRAKVLLTDAAPIGELCPDVPAALGELVSRMLSKDPARRPADAAAVCVELDALPPVPDGVRHPSPQELVATADLRWSGGSTTVRLVEAVQEASAASAGPAPPLLIAAACEPGATPRSDAASVDEVESRERPLRDKLAPFDARVAFLTDGSVVAMLPGEGSPEENAARGARCALAMREVIPRAAMVLITGRRQTVESGRRVTDPIDRTVRALGREALNILFSGSTRRAAGRPQEHAIWIDRRVAARLDARFLVEKGPGGHYLLGEQRPPRR